MQNSKKFKTKKIKIITGNELISIERERSFTTLLKSGAQEDWKVVLRVFMLC